MKTIIKIPLYVEIDSEDGLDRKVISTAIRSYFIPEFFNSLKVINLLGYFSSSSLRAIKRDVGENLRFKFISDFDLMQGGKPKIGNSNFEV